MASSHSTDRLKNELAEDSQDKHKNTTCPENDTGIGGGGDDSSSNSSDGTIAKGAAEPVFVSVATVHNGNNSNIIAADVAVDVAADVVAVGVASGVDYADPSFLSTTTSRDADEINIRGPSVAAVQVDSAVRVAHADLPSFSATTSFSVTISCDDDVDINGLSVAAAQVDGTAGVVYTNPRPFSAIASCDDDVYINGPNPDEIQVHGAAAAFNPQESSPLYRLPLELRRLIFHHVWT
jgi:hypothetical protein